MKMENTDIGIKTVDAIVSIALVNKKIWRLRNLQLFWIYSGIKPQGVKNMLIPDG